MVTLRDYIAYARTYIHPSLSDEAGQALVQAYLGQLQFSLLVSLVLLSSMCYTLPTATDMLKFGSNCGAVTAYPCQLEA